MMVNLKGKTEKITACVLAGALSLCIASAPLFAQHHATQDEPIDAPALDQDSWDKTHQGWRFTSHSQALNATSWKMIRATYKSASSGTWSLRARSLTWLGADGFKAQGQVRLWGPDNIYVTAFSCVWDGAHKITLGTIEGTKAPERPSIVGSDWRAFADMIEIDLLSADVLVKGLGGRLRLRMPSHKE